MFMHITKDLSWYRFAESSSADDAIDLDIKTESSDGEDSEIGASLIRYFLITLLYLCH